MQTVNINFTQCESLDCWITSKRERRQPSIAESIAIWRPFNLWPQSANPSPHTLQVTYCYTNIIYLLSFTIIRSPNKFFNVQHQPPNNILSAILLFNEYDRVFKILCLCCAHTLGVQLKVVLGIISFVISYRNICRRAFNCIRSLTRTSFFIRRACPASRCRPQKQ